MLKTYAFEDVVAFEMCGSPDGDNQILGQRFNCRQGLDTRNLTGITTSVKRCRQCGLIYANPLPVPLDIADHYGIPPEEYWSTAYLTYEPSHFGWQVDIALALLGSPAHRPHVALDVGCGIGKDIKTMLARGFDCYGVEPSPSFRERALEFTGLSQSRIIGSSIDDASFPVNTFDFISFGAVFEHLYHPALSLERALHWLRPGGIVHIEVPSSRWMVERIYHLFLKAKGSECTSYLSPMHSPYHLYSFSIRSFQALSCRLGFSILRHDYHVNAAMYVPRPLKKAVSYMMKMTGRGMQLSVWLEKSVV